MLSHTARKTTIVNFILEKRVRLEIALMTDKSRLRQVWQRRYVGNFTSSLTNMAELKVSYIRFTMEVRGKARESIVWYRYRQIILKQMIGSYLSLGTLVTMPLCSVVLPRCSIKLLTWWWDRKKCQIKNANATFWRKNLWLFCGEPSWLKSLVVIVWLAGTIEFYYMTCAAELAMLFQQYLALSSMWTRCGDDYRHWSKMVSSDRVNWRRFRRACCAKKCGLQRPGTNAANPNKMRRQLYDLYNIKIGQSKCC